jgi:hypothetical protein
MQMTRAAVTDVNRTDGTSFTHSDMSKAALNVQAGTRYIQIRIDRARGDVARGLDGYGTGPGYHNRVLAAERALQAHPTDPVAVLRRIYGR